jgi:hypothetical protein
VVIATEKLKSYKSPGTDQIPAELIKGGGERFYSKIHKLICSKWNKEELPQYRRNLLLYQFIKRAIRLTVIIIEESPSYQLPTKLYPTFLWPG